jgi:tetratricopeptide (TPR) repeat protein
MAGDNKAKILRDAEKYVSGGKILQAINEYLKIIKSDPNDVLTLNTVGDLYLRQGKVSEATRYFAQVAESYTRNNFLLKAIAVYKKILRADPENIDINQTLATLLAKQGLHVDARNQYMHVAELLTKAGKTRDSIEAYEKVVDLDPMSSAVQLKLAQIYLSEGNKDKALTHFTGAARAQAKSGDHKAAVASYQQVLAINPLEINVLKGLLDTCSHLNDVAPVLQQLEKSRALAPDNLGVLELLGQTYLAANDLDKATETFQQVVSRDEGHYPLFFSLSAARVEKEEFDEAALCLDPIIPILITRRETERAVEAYNLILNRKNDHVLALSKLIEIFSATNDQLRYLSTLERLTDLYLTTHRYREAVERAEALLQVAPDSEKYLIIHRGAFEKAFPGEEYAPPEPAETFHAASLASEKEGAGGRGGQTGEASILEIDLLLNYGMKEKALGLLQALEAQDPTDKEARIRLVSLYREANLSIKAAEECLALAALYRNLHQEEHAAKFLSEARRLAPELAGPRLDLAAFAAKHGIVLEAPANDAGPGVVGKPEPALEIDLSEDLSEIFFKDSAILEPSDEMEEIHVPPKRGAEEYSTRTPRVPSEESIQEQLQEVDFYIRLGFQDEARSKLDELAKEFPDNPELNLRYRQLDGDRAPEAEVPIALGPGEPEDIIPEEEGSAIEGNLFHAEARHASATTEATQVRQGLQRNTGTPDHARAEESSKYPDLLDEVNAISDEEIAKEDFETHFNLGIAYREMDLLDDAIKEFQIAFKTLDPANSPKEVVRCCGMLSTCFLEKGMPQSTIRWCQTGLSMPVVSEHESTALRYDMGVAFTELAEYRHALECFSKIFGIDPSYRDVAQKIDSLRGRS